MFEVGVFRVGDSLAQVKTNDEEFAATASWVFRDLAYGQAVGSETEHLRVVDYEIRVRERPWIDWEILCSGEPCDAVLRERDVVLSLQSEFHRLVMENGGPALRAAAVQIGASAIVLCGSSHSGKTTLAGWLTR